MASYGFLWLPMASYGFPWVPMGSCTVSKAGSRHDEEVPSGTSAHAARSCAPTKGRQGPANTSSFFEWVHVENKNKSRI